MDLHSRQNASDAFVNLRDSWSLGARQFRTFVPKRRPSLHETRCELWIAGLFLIELFRHSCYSTIQIGMVEALPFDLSFYLALKEHQKDNKGYTRIKIKDIKAAKVKSRGIKFQALVITDIGYDWTWGLDELRVDWLLGDAPRPDKISFASHHDTIPMCQMCQGQMGPSHWWIDLHGGRPAPDVRDTLDSARCAEGRCAHGNWRQHMTRHNVRLASHAATGHALGPGICCGTSVAAGQNAHRGYGYMIHHWETREHPETISHNAEHK